MRSAGHPLAGIDAVPPQKKQGIRPYRRTITFEPDTFMAADVAPSPNFDTRKGGPPDILLLHYTGMQTGDGA